MSPRIPSVLVHLTPADRVAVILRDGLKCKAKRTSTGNRPRKAVYLALHADILTDDANDGPAYEAMTTLYVNIEPYRHMLKADPEWRSHDNHAPELRDDDMAWFVETDIAPEHISLTPPVGYKQLDPFRP